MKILGTAADARTSASPEPSPAADSPEGMAEHRDTRVLDSEGPQVGLPDGWCRKADDEALLGGKPEQPVRFVAQEPTVVCLPQIVRETGQRVALCRRSKPVNTSRCVVRGLPSAVDIGQDVEPAGVLLTGMRYIIEIVRVVPDRCADDCCLLDAVCAHLVEELLHGPPGTLVGDGWRIGPPAPGVTVAVEKRTVRFAASHRDEPKHNRRARSHEAPGWCRVCC